MTALHELTGEFLGLQNLVEMGELTQLEIADTLEGITASIEDKAKSIGFIATNIDADIAALESEIDRLSARKKVMVNKKESLTDYLRFNMESSGIKSIKCPFFNITHVDGQDIVTIIDENLIPDDYVNVKTSVSPDKNAIKKALKDGAEIPGCRLDKGKSSIRIK